MPLPDKKSQPAATSDQPVSTFQKRAGAKLNEGPEAVAEFARHVVQMTGEMAAMARARRLDLLAYFLEMAKVEAQTCARREDEPQS